MIGIEKLKNVVCLLPAILFVGFGLHIIFESICVLYANYDKPAHDFLNFSHYKSLIVRKKKNESEFIPEILNIADKNLFVKAQYISVYSFIIYYKIKKSINFKSFSLLRE